MVQFILILLLIAFVSIIVLYIYFKRLKKNKEGKDEETINLVNNSEEYQPPPFPDVEEQKTNVNDIMQDEFKVRKVMTMIKQTPTQDDWAKFVEQKETLTSKIKNG
jgi:hypothetical protein